MKRVIIESPYAGDIEANTAYARRCVRDSTSTWASPGACSRASGRPWPSIARWNTGDCPTTRPSTRAEKPNLLDTVV